MQIYVDRTDGILDGTHGEINFDLGTPPKSDDDFNGVICVFLQKMINQLNTPFDEAGKANGVIFDIKPITSEVQKEGLSPVQPKSFK